MSGGEFYFTLPSETIHEHLKSFDGSDAIS